ncbi:MAG: alpha-ketoglutaric semialdehyde dehydrogenase, partial [Baekduia sp.]|nr:alpha-ketoglutaric semialdehyde dehydrogenase [Baekduia sp.]
CGRHLQSACLELGGKNPMVVAPDANLDLAVEGLQHRLAELTAPIGSWPAHRAAAAMAGLGRVTDGAIAGQLW